MAFKVEDCPCDCRHCSVCCMFGIGVASAMRPVIAKVQAADAERRAAERRVEVAVKVQATMFEAMDGSVGA